MEFIFVIVLIFVIIQMIMCLSFAGVCKWHYSLIEKMETKDEKEQLKGMKEEFLSFAQSIFSKCLTFF